jgi:putative transposase
MPGVAHHVTQRGTNRQVVFLSQSDRKVYLDLLRENSSKAGVAILAYCLMPNHIHLIAEPVEELALATMLRRVHGRYAQYFNARKQRSGHLWQNRFYSCPLERTHLWNAITYVERNPVRAGFVGRAEDFAWSSAAAHLGGKDTSRALDMGFWRDLGGARFWEELLRQEEPQSWRRELRRATFAGKALGSEEFLAYSRKHRETDGQVDFVRFAV